MSIHAREAATSPFRLFCSLLLVGAASQVALAQPGESPPETPTIQLHGLVSQGFMWSSDNNYLTRSSEGSVELTEVALNVTTQLTRHLRAGMQLFARDLGPIGNYELKFDWFYLDYRPFDWLGVRAGRTKIPFGLFNEYADIDSAFGPVLLPQAVYPTTNRDFLLAQTGAELYGFVDLCDGGALDYRIYGGTIFIDQPDAPASAPVRIVDLNVPYVFGARLMWETPLQGLRVGGTVQSLELDWRYLLQGPLELNIEFPVTIWLASAEYAFGDLTLAFEYSRWRGEVRSDNAAIFPTLKTTNERWYALVANRFTDWLQVGVYYSSFYPNVDKRHGHENYQHDVALTLRFDIGEHWLVKLEGHFMRGTAALDSALNDNKPLGQLTRDWGVFLAKTTASF